MNCARVLTTGYVCGRGGRVTWRLYRSDKVAINLHSQDGRLSRVQASKLDLLGKIERSQYVPKPFHHSEVREPLLPDLVGLVRVTSPTRCCYYIIVAEYRT